mgnify:FL=1|tara:strand:- start:36 stop:317 length:282 start_codon:yes stop_codon:yes gene_type:complete
MSDTDKKLLELIKRVEDLEKGYKQLCTQHDKNKQLFFLLNEMQGKAQKIGLATAKEIDKINGKDDIFKHNIESLINLFVTMDERVTDLEKASE